MTQNAYLRVALIARPHGVMGALKLIPLSDDLGRFNALDSAYLESKHEYKPIKILSKQIQHDSVIVTIEGIDSRNAAELLRNKYICVDRQHARELPQGEYFIVDIIGCKVVDTDGNDFGTLTDVFHTGANDVYQIKGSKGEILIPALKKLLQNVDIEKKLITLDAQVLTEVGLFEDSE
ncbi:MAG TPA: 16S rRNA processing protein RimM [Clostridiales bacterium]|jgi:16S rRNA processing protein RimM|nr:16S rRNA processing protein RimM [Clostridiales bacterium]